MTERTFREQSPARPSTSSGLPASRRQEPPVPQVPETYTNVPPIPPKSRQRASSIDELHVRKGALTRPSNNRNSIADFTPSQKTSSPGLAAARRVTSGATAPELDRTDSSNSINFSYPNRARPISPPPQKQNADVPTQTAQQTPKQTPERPKKPKQPPQVTPTTPQAALDTLSRTEAQNIQYQLTQASQQPVKQRRKRDTPLAEGSHLQTGTMGQKPVVTPLAPGPPMQEEDSPPDSNRGRNNARLAGQFSHFPQSPTSPTDSQTSPSEEDQSKARRIQRASGALQKQPSVVREDWEGEQDEMPSTVDSSPLPAKTASSKRPTTEANMSRKIEGNNNMKNELDQIDVSAPPQTLATPEQRRPSLSPSRSTRFSNKLSSDITEGQKHNPPPRSVSPRKPALKHTQSPQILPVDGQKPRDSSLSPSEATDLSDAVPARSKKGTHVKFDTHPAVVGVAAEPNYPESPQVVSPQYREKEKKWFSLTKKPQNRVAMSEDSDDDNAMKPRPMLPTFGSVRNGRRKEAEPSSSQKVIATPSPSSSSSSLSSETEPTTMNTSVSSDHAIGGVLARQSELNKKEMPSPLPPQVTSVEGTGMHSDSESTYSQDERDSQQVAQQPLPSQEPPIRQQPPVMQQPLQSFLEVKDPNNLPSIAVQPATPGTEEEQKHRDQWLVEVPGGFPSANQDVQPGTSTTTQQVAAVQQPVSYSKQIPDEDPADSPENRQERMPSIQEESDRDSLYSDAAEDLSDLEGDGFGSINAIVRSPVVTSQEAPSAAIDGAEATMPQRDIERESEEDSSAWADTGARWKDHAKNAQRISLQPAPEFAEKSAQRRAPIPAKTVVDPTPILTSSPAPTTDSIVTPVQSPTPVLSTKNARTSAQPSLKKSMRSQPDEDVGPTLRGKNRNLPNNEGPRPFRSSMRSEPEEDVGPTLRGKNRNLPNNEGPKPFRSSMRSEPEENVGPTMRSHNRNAPSDEGSKPFRTSMRGTGASATPVASAAPISQPAQVPGALQKKSLRTTAPTSSSTQQKILPINNDSDSESSFKRRRRARAQDAGKHTMRKSMRAGTGSSAEPATAPVNRTEVRATSPVERKPFSSAGTQPSMRTTLRGSTDNTPTLRGNQTGERRSSSLFGRKKEAKSPSRPLSAAGNFGKSRFADSDDEGGNRPKAFKSRFVDSSDDEDELRPVRGIPRTDKDDDSTDLDDSSDEEAEKRRRDNQPKKLSVVVPSSPPTSERPTSPTSPDGKKKRGFFSRLRKSKDETASPSNKEALTVTNGNEEPVKSPSRDANTAALGFKSDAEKEALIESTQRKLEAARERPMSPENGKLQRRNTPQRAISDSWPLPENPTEDERPATSDGAAQPQRPEFERQPSSGTAASSPVGSAEVIGRSGKKKRFPLLRKAFRLKD